jgi:hypothetical protein
MYDLKLDYSSELQTKAVFIWVTFLELKLHGLLAKET